MKAWTDYFVEHLERLRKEHPDIPKEELWFLYIKEIFKH